MDCTMLIILCIVHFSLAVLSFAASKMHLYSVNGFGIGLCIFITDI